MSTTLETAVSNIKKYLDFILNLSSIVFAAIGLTSRSGQEYPVAGGQYNQYQDDYYEQETAASTISERASELFSEMGKAINRDSRPLSSNKYNKY